MNHLQKENGFRKAFINPPDIGGRYSALSYFGLVPAAVTGVEIQKASWKCGDDDGKMFTSGCGKKYRADHRAVAGTLAKRKETN